MSDDFDYTKDSGGFDWKAGQESDLPDLTLPGGVADGRSADDVQKDMQRSEIPLGTYDFYIDKVIIPRNDDGSVKETPFKVFVGPKPGEKIQHNIDVINIELNLRTASHPDSMIKLFLTPPPRDPKQLAVYIAGGTAKSKAGWYWSIYKHFLGRLGLPMNADGSIPAETSNPRNWQRWGDGKPRLFTAEIVEGQENPEKPLKAGQKPFNQIKLFSYAESSDTKARLQSGNSAWRQGGSPVTTSRKDVQGPLIPSTSDPEPAKTATNGTNGATAPAPASNAVAAGEFDV